ncbi:MAG: FtsB family cell division protein, partial [Nitriliruptoraceae bacterium]
MTASHRWEERRRLRRLERRRRRGGDQRGPVLLQRTARVVRDGLARVQARLRRMVRGDRPLLVVTLGVLALAAVLVSAPLQSYLDGQARVDHLTRTAAALDRANAELSQRADDLERDTTVELLAREQLGLVFPGEVAYTLSPPPVAEP